jgi:hypothetical protein
MPSFSKELKWEIKELKVEVFAQSTGQPIDAAIARPLVARNPSDPQDG